MNELNIKVLSNLIRKRPPMSVVGVILALLLLAVIALQLALRTGWKTYGGLELQEVRAVAADHQGRVWATGYAQDGTSILFYIENGRQVQAPLPEELSLAGPISLVFDRQDRLWMGTDRGVIGRLDPNGDWRAYRSNPDFSVWEIVVDGQGLVWARSHRGPARIDPEAGVMDFSFLGGNLVDDDAVAIATDPQGQLWVLTMKRELKMLQPDGSWRTFMTVPGSVRISIFGSFLAFDDEGQIWMATGSGVGVLSPSGAWTEYPFDLSVQDLSMRGIFGDAHGRIWVAATHNGLYRFDPEAGWTNYTAQNSGLGDDANTLALDPQGQVWVGSYSGRLTRLNPEAALPVKSLPSVRSAARALTPAILLSLALFIMAATIHIRPGAVNRWQIIDFSLGFVAWYAVAVLVWGFLRYFSLPSGPVFFYINPLIVLVPVVHLILMVFFYVRQRQMARGAFSAMVVNSVGILLISPLAAGSVGTALFGAIFMTPFFLLF